MSSDTQPIPDYGFDVRKNFNHFYDLKQKLLKLSQKLLTEIKQSTSKHLKYLEDLYNSNIPLKDPAELPLDLSELSLSVQKFFDDFGSRVRQEEEDPRRKEDLRNSELPKMGKETRPVNETQIFISGLPPMCTNEDLHKLFQHCGDIVTTSVPPGEGQSRGFGFVTFTTPESTQEALKMNGSTFLNKSLKVQLSRQKTDNSRKVDNRTTVFVGNLSFYTNENTLIDFFKGIGEPKTVRIARDPAGNVRGFAHVEFYFPHHAYAALKLNDTVLNGRPIRIELAGGGKKMQEQNPYYQGRPGSGGNMMMYGQYAYNPYV
jgi:RNA recognition motif-containing protein